MEISHIYRIQKGDLLLELKACEAGGEDLRRKKIESICDTVAVERSQGSMVIKSKDLDEVTTKSELCKAFQS